MDIKDFTYGANAELDEKVAGIIDRDVFCNVSNMVSYILGQDGDGNAPFEWSDVENLRPDPSEWDVQRMLTYVHDNGFDTDAVADGLRTTIEIHCGDNEIETPEGYKDWTTAELFKWCEDHDQPTDASEDLLRDVISYNAEDAEVYEWWAVSGWLRDKLKEQGEVVIDGYPSVWGRQCTGQGIKLDQVFYDILKDIYHPE